MFIFSRGLTASSADFDCVVARGVVVVGTSKQPFFFFLDIEISTAIKQHEQRHRHFVVDLLPRHDEFLFTMSNHLSIYYRLSLNCLWPIPLFQQHVILDLCFPFIG
jgi:hypothetical protein